MAMGDPQSIAHQTALEDLMDCQNLSIVVSKKVRGLVRKAAQMKGSLHALFEINKALTSRIEKLEKAAQPATIAWTGDPEGDSFWGFNAPPDLPITTLAYFGDSLGQHIAMA